MVHRSCLVKCGTAGAVFLMVAGAWPAPAQRTEGITTPSPVGSPDTSRTNVLDEHQTFLTGRIQFDDGSPPSTAVVIERICGSTLYVEGHPDAKGNFGVNLGGRSATESISASDKSSSGGGMRGEALTAGIPGAKLMTERDIYGCELRASYPGYRSDSITLTSRRSFDEPNVGTIILHRIAGIQGTTISVTSALAPKDARRAYDKGIKLEGKASWQPAAAAFQTAVKVYPQYAAAWFELGKLEHAQNHLDQARQLYGRALQADPKYASPYQRLALIAVQESKWEEGARISRQGLDLNSIEFADLWYYQAVCQYNLHMFDVAGQAAQKTIDLDRFRRFPEAQLLLAGILTQQGNYAGAVLHLRAYLSEAPEAANAAMVRTNLAAIEPLAAARH